MEKGRDMLSFAEIFMPWRELSRRSSELASAESVRDDYRDRLQAAQAQLARFDHDGDGKAGGSKKKRPF